MNDVSLATGLVDSLIAKGSISAEDVLKLRQDIFRDGIADRAEAEAMFRLDSGCATKDPSWTQAYVDVMTDYFVWKAEPSKYVSEENARFLIGHVVADGRIDGVTELEMLINIIHWAESCPEMLAVFALEAVRESILSPETAVYGSNRPPAVISPADVEIVRKVIYAGASGGGFTVTRREAEMIFELNDSTIEQENAPSWGDLFVKAIANHLMFPRGAPVVPDAKEVRRRDAWLAERRGVGDIFKGMGKAFAKADIPIAEAWKEFDFLGKQSAKEEREREEAQTREALSRESIDAAEAQWLIGRVMADGVLHENERKLLQFIKQYAPHIDPSMNELFAKAGV
jgi:hypothetical protein